MQVSGFMKDGSPTSEVPTGFELPEIDFDRSVIQTDSPMYQNGERCSYAGALGSVCPGRRNGVSGILPEIITLIFRSVKKEPLLFWKEKILPIR